MCGIAGYVGQGSREVLERMTNALSHRGPDDAGFFVDRQWGLGHRRLSILDLSPSGHQPMLSPDGNVVIVFNGEIYNFQQLKNELLEKGHTFRGSSDTEVILALYAEHGLDCFRKMNGMFAIGLFDKKRERLILARDRLGKKPLYWTHAKGTLVFGSELKALLTHELVQKEIDLLSLNKYLAYDYVPTPHTILKGVFKLEPGSYLVYEKSQVQKTNFWDITFGNREISNSNRTLSALLTEMDERLSDAVKSRLIADVPVGIFLSGGLDSSTIAYYAQKASQQKIKTFSMGFAEKSFDESRYARRVAERIGSDHYEHILSAGECLDVISALPKYLDEPVADYSFIPTFLLSRFTRCHVTVALGGDGGDELFFGYPTFQAERLVRALNASKPLLQLASRVAPTSHSYFNLGFKLERLLAGLNVPTAYRHHAWMGTFGSVDRERLFAPEAWREIQKENVYEDIDRLNSQFLISNQSNLNRLVYLYLRTYLMDQVLVKVDRMSMANSLEVRAPFLDYTFVDFVNTIPLRYKIHGFTTKYLLKELMKDKLPRDIVYRKKQGFGVPLGAWFTKELRPFVEEALSAEMVRNIGILNPKMVKALVDEHMNGVRDNRKELWSLITFVRWHETWCR